MLTKAEKDLYRNQLFRHLDGITVAPSAYALHKAGVSDFILNNKRVSLSEIMRHFSANEGYLNVALRLLCSQGWLNQNVDNANDEITFEVNDQTKAAFEKFELYHDAVELLKLSEHFHERKFEIEPFVKLEQLFNNYELGYGIAESTDLLDNEIKDQILRHIEGVIIGPTLVKLGMNGMFHKYFMQASFRPEEFHRDAAGFGRLLDVLTKLGWFIKQNGSYRFTDKGLFFAKRASAYGVTVSYIPTLRKLDDLIFGNPQILRAGDQNSKEQHVDREMNVWGSGGAHSTYFKVVDKIIIDIFNKPIEEQPKGILDMGCGNGAFLKHLYLIIEGQTKRGQMLDDYPLMLIGADYNQAALKVSRDNLIQSDIWAKIIWGDIGNPDRLAADLMEMYNVDLKELLNVRTFLDHNRVWEVPQATDLKRLSVSSGAYATKGKRINNNLIAESLKQHFQKWTKYVERFGLLLIELHTVKPELAAKNVGKTAVTAYDATHGYSDQYIIEIPEFIEMLEEAGLIADPSHAKKFPNSDLATVSINLFKVNIK